MSPPLARPLRAHAQCWPWAGRSGSTGRPAQALPLLSTLRRRREARLGRAGRWRRRRARTAWAWRTSGCACWRSWSARSGRRCRARERRSWSCPRRNPTSACWTARRRSSRPPCRRWRRSFPARSATSPRWPRGSPTRAPATPRARTARWPSTASTTPASSWPSSPALASRCWSSRPTADQPQPIPLDCWPAGSPSHLLRPSSTAASPLSCGDPAGCLPGALGARPVASASLFCGHLRCLDWVSALWLGASACASSGPALLPAWCVGKDIP